MPRVITQPAAYAGPYASDISQLLAKHGKQMAFGRSLIMTLLIGEYENNLMTALAVYG